MIDLIFTNEENQVSNLDHCSPLGKSDHCVLSFSFHCCINFSAPSDRFRYESANFTTMRQYVMQNNSFNVITATTTTGNQDVNLLWNKFKNVLLNLRDLFVPRRKIANQKWKEKGSAPISEDIRNKIKEKKHLHRKWFNAFGQQKRSYYRSKYTRARNDVKKMLKKEKKRL